MDKEDATTCLAAIVAFALIPFMLIWNAWLFTIVYKWHVVPTFHVAPLSISEALGVSCAIRLLRHKPSQSTIKKEYREKPDISELCMQVFGAELVVVFVAWVALQYR